MSAPINTTVQDVKPNFISIGNTKAVFSSPGWAYNLAGLQYDAVGTPYGGSDSRQDTGPNNVTISAL